MASVKAELFGGQAASILAALALVLAVSALQWVYRVFFAAPLKNLRRLRAQGIPGYPFKPFLGQVPDILQAFAQRNKDSKLAAVTEATYFWAQGTRKFGKLWTFQAGATVGLVSADPDVVRQAYVLRNSQLPKQEFTRTSMAILGEGLVLSGGEHWRKQRRLMNPAFSTKEIKKLLPTMLRCTAATIHSWELTLSILGESSMTVQVDRTLAQLTMEIVFHSLFGMDVKGVLSSREQQDVLEALRTHFPASIQVAQQSFLIPGYRYLPTSLNRTVWRTRKTIEESIGKVIQARLAAHKKTKDASREKRGESENGKPKNSAEDSGDVLDLLIRASELAADGPEVDASLQEGSHDADAGKDGQGSEGASRRPQQAPDDARRAAPETAPMTAKELFDECVTLFAAGSDTTALLLTWTMMFLSQHPEWQEKVREEARDICSQRRGYWAPTFEDLSEMKTTSCVLYEALRLYPAAPLIARTSSEDVRLSDKLTLPVHCDFYMEIEMMHKDKELWGQDANEFHPERFANGMSKAAKHPGAFVPFSLGPRNCIGQHFALVEAKAILGAILSKFSFKLSDSYIHHPEAYTTQKPKHGMPIVITKLA